MADDDLGPGRRRRRRRRSSDNYLNHGKGILVLALHARSQADRRHVPGRDPGVVLPRRRLRAARPHRAADARARRS